MTDTMYVGTADQKFVNKMYRLRIKTLAIEWISEGRLESAETSD
jgi:hypothetical protein